MAAIRRDFISALALRVGQQALLRGWAYRVRELAKTTFIVLKDCSGQAQYVGATEALRGAHVRLDDAIEVPGVVREEPRAPTGVE